MAKKKSNPVGDNTATKAVDANGQHFEKNQKFIQLAKLITRDLNKNVRAPFFTRYSKTEIARYLANPYKYEKQLRHAVNYIYCASPHFRRVIQYFVGLSDLSYVVQPYKVDPKKASKRITGNNYRKVLNVLSSMSIRNQFPKILSVCLRDDVFYGTFWVTNDSITIQQLPSDRCAISSIEGNVLNVTFDFSYFSVDENLLNYYPPEFRAKYEYYKNNPATSRWIELDAPYSFAVKCNMDVLDYPIPPFAGLLREIYDIEDYKALKQTKTALENYAMIEMRLPFEDGEWGIDLDVARDFWSNLDQVLPEEIGSVLTPMPLNKISFERSNTGDTDTVANAEQSLFTAAGVSSLLFNNEKASANALLLSIKADQSMTFGIVKSIEEVVNRFIQSLSYGKNFKVTFIDCSPFNRKEVGEAYLKAASYGLPTISMYAASQGLGQAELDGMSFLENDVLELHSLFKPLQNSAQMSVSADTEADAVSASEPGAPEKSMEDLTESGEQNREDA